MTFIAHSSTRGVYRGGFTGITGKLVLSYCWPRSWEVPFSWILWTFQIVWDICVNLQTRHGMLREVDASAHSAPHRTSWHLSKVKIVPRAGQRDILYISLHVSNMLPLLETPLKNEETYYIFKELNTYVDDSLFTIYTYCQWTWTK